MRGAVEERISGTRALWLFTVALVVAAAVLRLLPHPPNFSPVGAMALFAGAHFASKRWAFAVPLVAMAVSDAVLGFHALTPVVYAAFAAVVGIGILLQRRRHAGWIALGSLTGSTLFFVVTNAAVWAVGDLYPPTAAGLAACFVAAVPFFAVSLLGDLVYAAALFGAYALMSRRVSPVAVATAR